MCVRYKPYISIYIMIIIRLSICMCVFQLKRVRAYKFRFTEVLNWKVTLAYTQMARQIRHEIRV